MSAATLDTPADLVPRRDPAVEVTPGPEPGAPSVVRTRDGRYVRLGADAAALLLELDRPRPAGAVAERLGPPWTGELVARTAASFDELELLDRGAPPPARRRLTYVAPLTVQLSLLDPARVLAPVAGALQRIPARLAGGVALAVAAAGLVLLVLQAGAVGDALARPPRLWEVLTVVGLLVAATTVHELGHGAALVARGGRPSRLGVMLFYLMPACFCDVSDAWRLPRRGDRVAIAAAGPATQTTLGAVAALVALVTSGSTAWIALVFAALCYVQALLNALPFVKLDGYIALISALDRPFLRRDAMREVRRAAGARLLGTPRDRRLAGRLVLPYGLVCALTPVYLVLSGLVLWTAVLVGFGLVGAWTGAALATALCAWALGSTLRGVRRARALGAPRWRLGAVGLLAGAVLAAVLASPVPDEVPAGYVRTADGVALVLPTERAVDAVRAGQPVTLERRGLARGDVVGRASVGPGAPRETEVPYAAVSALDVSLPVRAPVVALRDARLEPGARVAGAARVDAGERPLWRVAGDLLLGPLG